MARRRVLQYLVPMLSLAMLSGCGAPGSPIASLTQVRPSARPRFLPTLLSRHEKQAAAGTIRVRWGRGYRLPIPASVRHQAIGIADTPRGVLMLLPPGWLASSRSQWLLALSRYHPSPQNLAAGARVVARLATGKYSAQMTLAAITGGYALIAEQYPPGTRRDARLLSVDIDSGRTQRLHVWDPGRFSGLPFVDGRGVVAWWDAGTGHATALQLSSGKTVTIPGVGSGQALDWQNGMLWADGAPVRLPYLHAYRHPLPHGYRWLGSPPIIAVPSNWQTHPSSNTGTVEAANSRRPRMRVVVEVSHCGGCFLPAHILGGGGAGNTVEGPESPELSIRAGARLLWLSDHAIAYTLPSPYRGYGTYGVTVNGPQGGVVKAVITLPKEDKKTATTVLNSLWWP